MEAAEAEGQSLLHRSERRRRQIEAAIGAYTRSQSGLSHHRNHCARNARRSANSADAGISRRKVTGSRGPRNVSARSRNAYRWSTSCRGGETRYRARPRDSPPYRIARKIMHELRSAKTHFDLLGMHVHIHFLVGHVQKEQRRGENSSGQNVAISFMNRVENQAIADQATIHENINSIAIRALHLGARSEPAHC